MVDIRKWLVLTLLACNTAVTLPARAATGEYLFDTLKKPAYRASWDALFRGKRVPSWLARYSRTKNGPATPGKTVTLRGVAYQASFVCKAHDCADNRFAVLFAPRGRKAWGLLLTHDTTQRFFGNPSPEMRAALVKAMRD
jgi:hypothetical protein